MQKITDPDELEDYKYRMRKDYEDSIRRQVQHIGNWMKYAEWEQKLKEFRRARSIYERALEVDSRNVTIWLRYAEMEMKNKFVNHSRNIWERACKHLPGTDQFWLKYAYMEEVLCNYEKVREIFESWMTWTPRDTAWLAYLKFEERMKNVEGCRSILERFIDASPDMADPEATDAVGRYMKAAKFEEKLNERERARLFYERAVAELGEAALKENFFLAFCRFEIRCKQFDRARVLFRFALDRIPKGKAVKLYNAFVKFEKQYGTAEDMEEVVLNKRRTFYEGEIKREPYDYDIWFDYLRLEESTGDIENIRELYEKAIANEPPGQEKRFWERYIYLWIMYAVFEEDMAENPERAEKVYEAILQLIPHSSFSFSKIWIFYAQFQIRMGDIAKARKVFGQAIAKCPKEKVFHSYIEIEKQMGNFDRCRKIYKIWIEKFPNLANAWIEWAEFEASLEEPERVRSIFQIAVERDLDYPEAAWKAYIDFEISLSNFDKARDLFRLLLDKTNHVKVWISFAKFELENVDSYENCRAVYAEAYNKLKTEEPDLKEERLMILESWIKVEEKYGTEEGYEEVKNKMPKRVKKRRKIKIIYNQQDAEMGNKEDEGGWEEFYDYIFPDDEAQKRNIKILEMAQKWKKKAEDN